MFVSLFKTLSYYEPLGVFMEKPLTQTQYNTQPIWKSATCESFQELSIDLITVVFCQLKREKGSISVNVQWKHTSLIARLILHYRCALTLLKAIMDDDYGYVVLFFCPVVHSLQYFIEVMQPGAKDFVKTKIGKRECKLLRLTIQPRRLCEYQEMVH